ncbi:MAG TPA: aldo/keto reductase, partial [Anaerolineaceae bacterium]|nr:aldo/keto reductase [Anaerolineaceae bacterium]
MEKRELGRTGHFSTLAIFGGAAFWDITQSVVDTVMEQVIAAGVNHIDVAPSYGVAEERLGPWLKRERQRFFLGCKTMERTAESSWKEIHASMKRLQVEQFDLYQIHAITSQEELDAAMQKGGVIETLIRAREEGLTRYLGITGHGMQTPQLFLQAIERFDFDTVMFPLNYGLLGQEQYRTDALKLIDACKQRDIGRMIIKSVTKGPWNEKPKTHTTWYEPFNTPVHIQEAVNFVLSQDVTGLCMAGDITVIPMILQACEQFTPLSEEEQFALI